MSTKSEYLQYTMLRTVYYSLGPFYYRMSSIVSERFDSLSATGNVSRSDGVVSKLNFLLAAPEQPAQRENAERVNQEEIEVAAETPSTSCSSLPPSRPPPANPSLPRLPRLADQRTRTKLELKRKREEEEKAATERRILIELGRARPIPITALAPGKTESRRSRENKKSGKSVTAKSAEKATEVNPPPDSAQEQSPLASDQKDPLPLNETNPSVATTPSPDKVTEQRDGEPTSAGSSSFAATRSPCKSRRSILKEKLPKRREDAPSKAVESSGETFQQKLKAVTDLDDGDVLLQRIGDRVASSLGEHLVPGQMPVLTDDDDLLDSFLELIGQNNDGAAEELDLSSTDSPHKNKVTGLQTPTHCSSDNFESLSVNVTNYPSSGGCRAGEKVRLETEKSPQCGNDVQAPIPGPSGESVTKSKADCTATSVEGQVKEKPEVVPESSALHESDLRAAIPGPSGESASESKTVSATTDDVTSQAQLDIAVESQAAVDDRLSNPNPGSEVPRSSKSYPARDSLEQEAPPLETLARQNRESGSEKDVSVLPIVVLSNDQEVQAAPNTLQNTGNDIPEVHAARQDAVPKQKAVSRSRRRKSPELARVVSEAKEVLKADEELKRTKGKTSLPPPGSPARTRSRAKRELLQTELARKRAISSFRVSMATILWRENCGGGEISRPIYRSDLKSGSKKASSVFADAARVVQAQQSVVSMEGYTIQYVDEHGTIVDAAPSRRCRRLRRSTAPPT